MNRSLTQNSGHSLLFTACALIGLFCLLEEPKPAERPSFGTSSGLILAFSFTIYLLFFGLLSHLQSARLYALTVPFLIFASSVCMIRLWYYHPRFGRPGSVLLALLLCITMGVESQGYLSKSSGLVAASDSIVKHIKADRVVRANPSPQVAHRLYTKYREMPSFKLRALGDPRDSNFDSDNPPIILIQDGIDIVTSVALLEKYDQPGNMDVVALQSLIERVRQLAQSGNLIFAAEDKFYNTPYYYLEGVYSWDSYHKIKELLPGARDSIYVYITDPSRLKTNGEKP